MKLQIILLTIFILKVTDSLFIQSGETELVGHPSFIGSEAGEVNIYGGKNATIKSAPYVGSITDKYGYLFGTAIILNNTWIATAAYNFIGLRPSDVIIRVGSSDSNKGGHTFTVSKIVRHPKYRGSWEYDIALAKLSKKISFSSTVNHIELGSTLPKKNGDKGMVYGFGWNEKGKSGFLKEVEGPYMNYKSCKSHYKKHSSFTKLSFCSAKTGSGPCAFDFGSPFVYKKKLLGIFSGTFGCGSETYPAVYADITKYKKWITGKK